MRIFSGLMIATVLSGVVLVGMPSAVCSQEPVQELNIVSRSMLPDAPEPQRDIATGSSQEVQTGEDQTGKGEKGQDEGSQAPGAESTIKKQPAPQPKRILGVMPNYRAVSAGVRPPPFTPREAFKVATENSFDYSSFVFVGITSLLAEGTNAHPQLGKGVGGYWAYYWRGYFDKTDGNYMVDFAMPIVFHEDERYYAMGEGGVWKRGVYASTRVLITPSFSGKNGLNASEILGRGISQAISLSYYPSQTQTLSGYTEKYAYAIGRDALTNVFREFWPDINAHVFHRQH